MTSNFRIIISGMFLVMMLGCSSQIGGVGPGMEPQEAIVKELGDLLRCGSGVPKQLADLNSFEPNFPISYRAIKTGEMVVLWGIPMLGEGNASTSEGTIVAYEKDAATAGGWVLMTNGTAKKVTVVDFATFRKAAK